MERRTRTNAVGPTFCTSNAFKVAFYDGSRRKDKRGAGIDNCRCIDALRDLVAEATKASQQNLPVTLHRHWDRHECVVIERSVVRVTNDQLAFSSLGGELETEER